jgi:tRNA(Leu) C34 or U34 (ribose-2'-O)-methylase TrmL
MLPGLRSLNVAIAAAMVAGEALRQIRSAKAELPT